MSYRKSDIEYHSDGYRPSRPAVNVKVHGYWGRVPLPLDLGACDGVPVVTDPAFTHEWVEALPESTLQAAWESCCEQAWEMLQSDATELFGKEAKVYSEGRSGGWAVVHGLPDVASWDALMVSKWARFEKYAKAYAADIPRGLLDWVYFNVYTPEAERASLSAQGMCE